MTYKNKSLAQLKKIAQRHFNKWIRERDKGQPCINCGDFKELQAGHFLPTSTYGGLRFSEANTNGECLKCNYFNSQSHGLPGHYRDNLIKKIGEQRFKDLEDLAGYYKRHPHKFDRFELIEIIEKYKNK